MRGRVVRIGNSRGIRIPKALLEEAGLVDEVEIVVHGNRLVVTPVRSPRAGWSELFEEMRRRGDDALLDGERLPSTDWEETGWKW